MDARSITTTYTYDRLNRVTLRAYTNEPSGSETPDVTYYYDNITNAKGKLTKVTSSVSTTEYTSFDISGRVTASKQTTDGTTYGNGSTDSPMTYTYNLAGMLIEQQYPSGRKVQNVLDSNGDLEMVKARKNASSGYWAYANNFNYNAAGAVTSMQLGNGTWESTAFNSRLQPTQIALGTVKDGYDKLDLDYTYGTANNGNVLTQSINFTGLAHPFQQTYTYDSLNRISTAEETYNSGQTWKQAFKYDRYGNRNFDEANTTTLTRACGSSPSFTICTADRKRENPAIVPDSNKIKLDQDGDFEDDYRFDDAGNTTKDPGSRKFTYDAENKQMKVETVDSEDEVIGTVGQYWYDGDGKRVKKYIPPGGEDPGEVTVFIYDAFGKLVVEYSTVVADNNAAKVAYLTNDHLGSPRINTDKNGNVTARHDYHPFGEEIATAQRTTGLAYAEDTVRKQFTGYERDRETELDFAQARMYSNGLGRFSSADPLMASADIVDPRTFNRYVYVGNNPVNITDPSGLIWGALNGKVKWYEDMDALKAAGAAVYDSLIGDVNGQHVLLNANGPGYSFITSNAAALQDMARLGATAAQLSASAAILAGSVAGAGALLAGAGVVLATGGVVYLYTQYPAALGKMRAAGCPASIECPSLDDVRMMESLQMTNAGDNSNSSSGAPNLGGETSPADPNSRNPKDVDNEPTKGSVPLKLTKEQISQSRIIARGNGIGDVARLVQDYGGRAKDWVKKSTSVTEINGRRAEIHWYQNKAVGKVELKVKYLD